MSDYISRDVAKAFFTPPKNVTFLTPLYFRQEDVIATLDNIPTAFEDAQVAPLPAADVRPVVRGKWIDHQEGRWIYAKCSECGTVHDVKSNFCPNCGADMREES